MRVYPAVPAPCRTVRGRNRRIRVVESDRALAAPGRCRCVKWSCVAWAVCATRAMVALASPLLSFLYIDLLVKTRFIVLRMTKQYLLDRVVLLWESRD